MRGPIHRTAATHPAGASASSVIHAGPPDSGAQRCLHFPTLAGGIGFSGPRHPGGAGGVLDAHVQVGEAAGSDGSGVPFGRKGQLGLARKEERVADRARRQLGERLACLLRRDDGARPAAGESIDGRVAGAATREPVEPRHERAAAGVFGQAGKAKADPGPARGLQRAGQVDDEPLAAGLEAVSAHRRPRDRDLELMPRVARLGSHVDDQPARRGRAQRHEERGRGPQQRREIVRAKPGRPLEAAFLEELASSVPGRTDTQADRSSANGAAATRSCTATGPGRAHDAAARVTTARAGRRIQCTGKKWRV